MPAVYRRATDVRRLGVDGRRDARRSWAGAATVRVLHNGTDPAPSDGSRRRSRSGWSSSVGSSPHKRVDLVVRAFGGGPRRGARD